MRLVCRMTRESARRVKVEARATDGTLWEHSSPLENGTHYRAAERDLGVPADCLRAAKSRLGTAPVEFCHGEDPAPFAVRVRGRMERDDAARVVAAADPLDAIRQALDVTDYPAPEPLICWDGLDVLAAVDLDYHGRPLDARPSEDQLRALAALVSPLPRAVWTTHGRGLRLIYGALDGYTAGELAAVAGLALVSREPSARVEVKNITRHPGYLRDGLPCGPVAWVPANADLSATRAWLGRSTVEAGEVAEYLDARGMQAGRRYPHDRCPARPDEPGGRDPVTVHEGGIFCHRCAGAGVLLGSRKPGWFPFGALCGRSIDTTLSACIRRLAHWEHARHVVEDATGLYGAVAELAYRAACKVLHGPDDPRVPLVTCAGSNLVRFRNGWCHLDGTPYTNHEPVIASLPAAMVRTVDGAAGSRELVARLMQSADLSPLGYPALTPVIGHRIYTHRLPPRNPATVPVVIQAGDLARDVFAPFRPRYRPAAGRDVEGAWALLEKILPGLNRNYVTLLLAARGCVEGEGGLPPLIFAYGPTGASKSATIHVACAIMGDRATEVVWTSQVERLRQGIMQAKESGTVCVFNEFVKDARRGETEGNRYGNAGGAASAMEFVLNITPDSVSHALYRGQVRLGTPPVCIWTDTTIPPFVRQHAQIGRRVVSVHLAGSVRWEATLSEHGITRPAALRTEGGPEVAAACDVILSDVIDRYFTSPRDFVSIAEELGYPLIANAPEAQEARERVRQLFRLVCAAPPLTGSDAKRTSGKGWVDVPYLGDSDLASLWRDIGGTDGNAADRVCEHDLTRLLLGAPADCPVVFDSRVHGRRIFVRFRQGEPRSPHTLYNSEIIDPAELAVDDDDAQPAAPPAPPPPAPAPADNSNPWGDLSWVTRLP